MDKSSSSKSKTLKVCLLQFKPVYKKIKKSMKIADNLLSEYSEDDNIDVLLLPEMAFTGYKFDNRKDIEPYLEAAGVGLTFDWWAQKAKELNWYVFCGYPEKLDDKMYNSQLVVSREGEFIKSYKKTFLYETDITWADEGPGFETTDITNIGGDTIKVGNGIWMDINPKEFKAPFEDCEFANFHADNEVDVILFSSNWVDSKEYQSDKEVIKSTLNYWWIRLLPFLICEKENQGFPKYFVCSDRVGEERGSIYLGWSWILDRTKVLNCFTNKIKVLVKLYFEVPE